MAVSSTSFKSEFPEIGQRIEERLEKLAINKDLEKMEKLQIYLLNYATEVSRAELTLMKQENAELVEANKKDEEFIKRQKLVNRIYHIENLHIQTYQE